MAGSDRKIGHLSLCFVSKQSISKNKNNGGALGAEMVKSEIKFLR